MLDIKWIRENPEKFDDSLRKRRIDPLAHKVIALDEERRHLITIIQQLQHERKNKSRVLSTVTNKDHKEFEDIKREVEDINEKLEALSAQAANDHELNNLLSMLPNLPADEVPYGTDESMNKLVRTNGAIPHLSAPKQHFELGSELGIMDFTKTAQMSGSRFVTLKGSLARLERALINFMIDVHTEEFKFFELSPPALVRESAMYNVGQLPKFAHESFSTTNHYRLIPTGEVPLVNMVAGSMLPREALPIRYVSYTPCFRSEAGSSGKDTRGMIRLHQFGKVELVSVTTADEAAYEHEYITNCAEEILKRLHLPYRIMLLCTGDMGFSARKTYDIEVWLPGQNAYREISSCSDCGDFQARRMKTKYKEFGSSQTNFVHTLNGSALPIGRTMVAILENYQNEDGTIKIPDVLVGYMGGIKKIDMVSM